MIIKNIHSSIGKRKILNPVIYSELKDHTLILVNKISQGMKIIIIIKHDIKIAFMLLANFNFCSKDLIKGKESDRIKTSK